MVDLFLLSLLAAEALSVRYFFYFLGSCVWLQQRSFFSLCIFSGVCVLCVKATSYL